MRFEYEQEVKVWAAKEGAHGTPNHYHAVVGKVRIEVDIDLKKAMAARASTVATGSASSVEQMAQVNPALKHLPDDLRAWIHLALQKAAEISAGDVHA